MERDQPDHRYSLGFDWDLIPSQTLEKLRKQIQEHGFYNMTVEVEGTFYETKVYVPQLAALFGEWIIKVENLDNRSAGESLYTAIKIHPYAVSYAKSFQEGEMFFEKEYKKPLKDLTSKDERLLHLHFYHTQHEKQFDDGWHYWKDHAPTILTHKVIRRYGYYAGIISQVEDLIDKDPILFKGFGLCDLMYHAPPEEYNLDIIAYLEKARNAKNQTIPYSLFEEAYKQGVSCFNFRIPSTEDDFYCFEPRLTLFLNDPKVDVFNSDTTAPTTINGKDYLCIYKKGFLQGVKEFQDEYSPNNTVFQGYNYSVIISEKMYGTPESPYDGWYYKMSQFSSKISGKTIEQRGYYNGLVYKVLEQVEKLGSQGEKVFRKQQARVDDARAERMKQTIDLANTIAKRSGIELQVNSTTPIKPRKTQKGKEKRWDDYRKTFANYQSLEGKNRLEAIRLTAEKHGISIDTVERALGLKN